MIFYYILLVCGRVESGYNISLSEAEMKECEEGHIFCVDEMVDVRRMDQVRNYLIALKRASDQNELNRLYQEYDELSKDSFSDEAKLEEIIEGETDEYNYPKEFCPICQLRHIRNSELLSYICHKTGIDKKELISEIKSKYKNLDEMKADLK